MNTLNKYITLPHKKTAVLRPQGSPKSEPTQLNSGQKIKRCVDVLPVPSVF